MPAHGRLASHLALRRLWPYRAPRLLVARLGRRARLVLPRPQGRSDRRTDSWTTQIRDRVVLVLDRQRRRVVCDPVVGSRHARGRSWHVGWSDAHGQTDVLAVLVETPSSARPVRVDVV